MLLLFKEKVDLLSFWGSADTQNFVCLVFTSSFLQPRDYYYDQMFILAFMLLIDERSEIVKGVEIQKRKKKIDMRQSGEG